MTYGLHILTRNRPGRRLRALVGLHFTDPALVPILCLLKWFTIIDQRRIYRFEEGIAQTGIHESGVLTVIYPPTFVDMPENVQAWFDA